jgi:hypothetical protein
MGGQRGFDLSRFDPEAPNLHLSIVPALELERAIGSAAS